MDELIRCTSGRGAKHVPRLGGIVGDCDTCKGTGKIKLSDKPVPVVSVVSELVEDVVQACERVNDNNVPDDSILPNVDNLDDFIKPLPDLNQLPVDIVKAVADLPIPEPEPVKATRKPKIFKRKVAK